MPPPRVVAHPGWLGGAPRLDGTRLGVEWFTYHRDEPREFFSQYWPYVTDEHLALMFAVVDAVREANREMAVPFAGPAPSQHEEGE